MPKRRYVMTYPRQSWWANKKDSMRDTLQASLFAVGVILFLMVTVVYMNQHS